MNNGRPLISIVIVNWNGQSWLRKCIDSLIGQTYKSIEIIVVDNGSTDNSVNLLKKEYKELLIVENSNNLGFAGGNNIGIKHASGEYILLINTDTWIEKDTIERLYADMIERRLDVVAPYEAFYDGSLRKKDYVTRIDIFGHPVYLNRTITNDNFYLCGVCLLFKKSLYLETGGLDDSFFMYVEECDWFWRLILMRKSFDYAESIYVYHAGAGSSGAGLKAQKFLWRNENTARMLFKNYSWYTLLILVPVYIAINLGESLFFLFTGRFDVSYTYPKSWINVLRDYRYILKSRRVIQDERLISDFAVFKKMYVGIGKLRHLKFFLRVRNEKNN